MRPFVVTMGLVAVLASVSGLARAADLQIMCDSSLSMDKSADGLTDKYFCAGSLTLSSGSLLLGANSVYFEAHKQVSLVDATIQAQQISLIAPKVAIDNLSSIYADSTVVIGTGTMPTGAGQGPLEPLDRVAGSTLQLGGVVYELIQPMSIVGSELDKWVATSGGTMILSSVPEPKSWAMLLLGASLFLLCSRRISHRI